MNNENYKTYNNKNINVGANNSQRNQKIKKIINEELKKRSLFLNFFIVLGTILFLGGIVLLTLSILKIVGTINFTEWKIPQFILELWFAIPVFCIIFFIFISIYSNYYRFWNEKKIYYQTKDTYDLQRIPNFIISKYKNLLTIRIFSNWIFIVFYIFVILLTLLTYLWFGWLRNLDWAFKDEFIKHIDQFVEDKFLITKANKNFILIAISIFTTALVILHAFYNVWIMRQKVNIELLFDLKQKIDMGEIRAHTRKIHLIAFLCIFIPIVVLIIIWKIIKKFKK